MAGEDAQTVDERTLLGLLYDPFSEEIRVDPYPIYRRLRERQPFYWHPIGFWIATRYAECDAILRDRRFRTVDPHAWQGGLQAQAAAEHVGTLRTVLHKTMLFAPPGDHQRFRGPLNRAFAPKVVEERRQRIRSIADRLVAGFPAHGAFDFMDAFASPFPILLLADILGIPGADQRRFADWSRTISPILDPIQRPEAIAAAATSMREFDPYIRSLIRQRRQRPQDDLLSLMVQAGEDGQSLTEDELVANVGFLIAAGHGTATHLMGNGIWTLLRTPGVWQRVRAEPRILPMTVDEILRYESPAQMTVREATEDVFVANRLISKGRRVLLLLGAANRDPAVFKDPESFDPARHPNPHLAYSGGAHYCLGAALAGIEGQEAFAALAEGAKTLRLAQEPVEWQKTITMRGFRHLPVRLD